MAIPLFIVGMPRSGTTLIEAAIAAHDDVLPGGELSALPFVFEEFMTWATESGWSGGPIPKTGLPSGASATAPSIANSGSMARAMSPTSNLRIFLLWA
ncbi:sulfotransferase [Hyphobacterium sp. CCMP332]|nr:sulfotransferase [Hyphobacterium sp. CCMP332]